MPPVNQEQYAKRFNQLVGKRTGRPVTPHKAVTKQAIQERRRQADQGAGRSAIRAWVQAGGGKVPADVRNKSKAVFASSGSYSPLKSSKEVFNTIYNNLTRQFNQQIADQNSIKTEYAASVLDQAVDPNNPSKVPTPVEATKAKGTNNPVGEDPNSVEAQAKKLGVELAPSIDEQYLGGNLQKYVVDPIARAVSTIPSGVYGGIEAGVAGNKAGESSLQKLGDVIAGMGKGFVEPLRSDEPGARKGWGDIYEIYQTESPDPLASGLRKLEKSHPLVEEQISRIAGLTGDIVLDPIGKHIGGAKTGVIAGERATASSMEKYLSKTANDIAAKAESDIVTSLPKARAIDPLTGDPYRYAPSEQAVAQQVNKALQDYREAAQIEISGGGSKGRYELHNRNLTSIMVGKQGGEAVGKALTMHFDDAVQRVIDGAEGRGQKLSGADLAAHAEVNADFDQWLTQVTDRLVSENKLPPNPTMDQVANRLSTADRVLLREEQQAVIDSRYSSYIKDASDEITRNFRNNYYNAPGIRIGKKVIPVKAAGKAFATLEDKFMGPHVAENFRYGATFPGSLGLDTTRARAWTVVGTEQFEKDLREQAKHYTAQEAKEIQHSIEHNTKISPRLQPVKDWIVGQYKYMYEQELAAGARGRKRFSQTPIDPYDPNYAHVATRGKSVEERTGFKRNRKAEIHANVNKGITPAAGRFKTENAIAEGLRPVENAFEALRQRRYKYNRDMTRAQFRTDMIDKYGFTTRLSKAGRGFAAHERGLSQIEFHRLPENLRQQIEHTGEEYFLPREMYDKLTEFDRITKWNGASQQQIVRQMTKVMNFVKRLQTLPFPGFHNKNMIGDVFMSLLDNVNFDDYMWTFKKYMERKLGKKAEWDIVPGLKTNFEREWDIYQHEANSGFVSAELGGLSAPTKYNLPKRVISKVEHKVQGWSGYREDAGRFTHYVTSYKQEAKELWKRGERDLAVIDRKARSAALWRVNNYKFDYNAISLWEKQAKTLFFPYYTFFRKAAPTLLQALYQDPRWIAQWTNFMYKHSVHGEEGAAGFDGFRIPSDVRDQGYAFLPGQENQDQPWYVSNDILPTSVLGQINTGSPHGFANSILSQAAMPYQIAIEQATGKELFLDRPLNKNQSFAEYMMNKVPGGREGEQLFGTDKPWAERALTSRAMLGLPIRKLRENQQLFALNEWQDKLIDQPIDDFNKSQDMVYISRQMSQDGKARIYTVNDQTIKDAQGGGQPIQSFYTAKEAINFAKKFIPENYDKVQRTWDINDQGVPVHRPVKK